MKVGDLVSKEDPCGDRLGLTGLVLAIIDDFEIPPLIEVMWDNGYVSRTYQDEITVLCKPAVNMIQ